MTTSINAVLAEIKSQMDAAWGSGGDDSVNKVYDYRTFPDKQLVTIALSYQGGDPTGLSQTVGGSYPAYDITAVCGIQMVRDASDRITETAVRNADQTLNDLENAIWVLFGRGGDAYKNNLWLKAAIMPSVRPPSFVDAPTTRYSEIPMRFYVK